MTALTWFSFTTQTIAVNVLHFVTGYSQPSPYQIFYFFHEFLLFTENNFAVFVAEPQVTQTVDLQEDEPLFSF